VKAGSKATKTIEIENSGEQEATMTFQTSNPEFSVPAGIVTVPPKSTYELTVEFRPSSAGPAIADIKVVSSDPDSPEQVFKIGANGADVGAPPEDDDGGPNADSGCGCKTAGTSSTIPSWAGMGLLALGATVLVRRRARS
jgi:MYXO-CTERM domain-containing protein